MHKARPITLPLLALAMLSMLSACGSQQKVSQKTEYVRRPDAPSEPIVFSSAPTRDSVALREADEHLSAADWAMLERMGPRTVWDQLSKKKPRKSSLHATTSPEKSNRPYGTTTTQPLNNGTTERELPVTVVELPDGKLRMIWSLRSFGGSAVTSARDAVTARRTVTITPTDLAPLVSVLTQYVGNGGTVLPLARENTVVITCVAENKDSVLDVLDRLDTAPRQVEITAKIFEVSHDFDFQQGAQVLLNRLASDNSQDLTSTFSAKRFADAMSGNGSTPVQGSVLQLMQTFENAGVTLDATFQLLSEAGLIKVVSSPRMTVAAGQTGYMLAGQELPIQTTTVANNATQFSTQYKPVGVQLYITPQAVGPDRIKLHAISIVSSVAGFAPLPTMTGGQTQLNQALVNPIIDSREAETAVTIDDGNTLVISGMRMIRTTTRENKIPGLGDLPALGWLFKNHRTQQQLTDLYFFVTPALL